MSTSVRKPKAELLEEKFYAALRDVFVGAKVEGESGYINLMRIKSRYFTEGVFPKLKETIAAELAAFPDFKGELFDKLYTFFHRYFSESGSIYFRHTALHQNVYERVYTNERDVMLFWKTHMLYYVKTDRLFRSLTVEPEREGGLRFFFDASTLQNKKNNEKRELIYDFKERREADGTLVFAVGYSERGRKTKTDEIVKRLKKEAQVRATTDELERAFRLFERQSEVDYFINRDARQFLEEQFRLWLYQYVFRGESVWTERRIGELQALQRVALRVVDFIAQFEDELVKVWNKPKFVRRSNYVITLDKIEGRDGALARRLLADAGMEGQTAEWRELNIVGAQFEAADVWTKDLTGEHLDERYRFLPVDTRHFKGLEPEILALFDDLDDALDGWLIKSENYQALNTILPKFRGRVKCIYIDPPYNTGPSEIIYKNFYKHSSWASLMADRVELARSFKEAGGVMIIAIDDNELANLWKIVEMQFTDHDITPVVVVHNPRGNITNNFAKVHEYALFITEQASSSILRTREESGGLRKMRRWGAASLRTDRPTMFYPIYVKDGKITRIGDRPDDDFHPCGKNVRLDTGETEVWPIDQDGVERRWNFSLDSIHDNLDRIVVVESDGVFDLFLNAEESVPKTVWSGGEFDAGKYGNNLLQNIIGQQLFSYPKSISTVAQSIDIVCRDDANSTILDFFAGSGTTAHAVINLNREDGGRRKYVLVEANEYFHTVILPRIKKVVFGDKWKDGKPAPGSAGTSHFCKYYELEQYEETLQRAKYEDSTFFDNPYEDPFHSYVFLRDVKLLDAVEVDRERETVRIDFARLYPDVDAAETLSNLLGKRVKRLAPGEVEFTDGEKIALNNLDFKTVKPLIWWQ